MLSSACQYGLRAMIYLAQQPGDVYLPVRRISSTLDVSHPFLAKILQQLVIKDMLVSLRGPSGGVKLARASTKIRLNDIVLAIDGQKVFDSCVLGLPGCGHRRPCPMHEAWGELRSNFCDMLEKTTLAAFAERTEVGGFRLTPT
ncbi:MAG: transcriptional regulator [Bacteroidetes bacterium CG12_big_fil_rev_8_21_14_0_65_60_17]|nr:MAG: transcriptional regulator [Bacteroidetes bacterium CG12_big_fil_rev_8_21_14_0_65_60_17]